MAKPLQILFLLIFLGVGTSVLAQKGGSGNPNVSTINPCQLFVPNAFTPNGDDINDRFLVKYNGECRMISFEMHVFDRWGRLVFETRDADYTKAWDGTTDGMELKEGVYMWKVSCKLVDPAKPEEAHLINQQGSVVLIR